MGGCVSSVMSAKNDGSVVPHELIQAYRARPSVITEVAPATADCSATYISSTTYELGDMSPENIPNLHKKMFNTDPLLVSLGKACKRFHIRPAMTLRPIDHIEKKEETLPNGKKRVMEITHLKPSVHVSYTELWEKVTAFGVGLSKIGVKPKMHLGLYEDTRMEWIVACQGAWFAGAIGVTVYANLGEDALRYAITEADLDFMFCNGRLIKNIVPLVGERKNRTVFIYTDELPVGLDLNGCTAYSFDEVLELGKKEIASNASAVSDDENKPSPFTPKPDDTALIMYTSGTTGDPKGVVMAHGNISAAVTLLFHRLQKFYPDPEFRYVYCGFLPLAHILEFACEMIMLTKGATVGYGSARTLTDATAKPHGDLTEHRPHFIVAVPRVWDTIRKAVEANIPPGLKKRIFQDAYAARWSYLQKGQDTPYYNEKVFSAVRQRLGGRVTSVLSGGGPLSEKTLEFLWVTTGCNVVQGYGSTESCTIATTQQLGEVDLDSVGSPLETVEYKLRDTENWKHTDLPNPRGEILVRNAAVTKGYFKQPEKTAEVFTEDGWYCTGDVGELMPSNHLRIIGRVKALAKNAFGEYIALEALEALYCLNDLAQANGVCMLVSKEKAYVTALVLTDEARAMKFAKANGIEGTYPAILENPTFAKKVNESFINTAKQHKRKNFETVRFVKLLAEEWTPENGIMTAAQKLRRAEVDKRYKKEIAELFAADE